jgi:hypothetical protein
MPKDDEDAEVIFRKLPASLTQELALAQLNGNYDETTLWVKISKDLCDLLGISTHTLRQWVSDEKVISRFEGGRRLVHYNDLKRKVARE